jgi:uncharacterized membrane protein
MRDFYWVVVAVVLAVVVHIVTLIFAPGYVFENSLNRLAADIPNNQFFVLSREAQSKIFPEYPQDAIFGICRFDLTVGPVELKASLPDTLWTLTVYSKSGKTLYTVTDQQAGSDTLNLKLAMAPGLFDIFSAKGEDDDDPVASSGWKVLSSDERGFALFWVPSYDQAMRANLSETLAKSSCNRASS